MSNRRRGVDVVGDRDHDVGCLDLNLGGGGPRFDIARKLKSLGGPFIFVTGYDPDVVPGDMRVVGRLQKSVKMLEVVEVVGQLQPIH